MRSIIEKAIDRIHIVDMSKRSILLAVESALKSFLEIYEKFDESTRRMIKETCRREKISISDDLEPLIRLGICILVIDDEEKLRELYNNIRKIKTDDEYIRIILELLLNIIDQRVSH